MDSSRSLIILAVGALIVLGTLITLLPVLLQGFRVQPLASLPDRASTQAELLAEEILQAAPPVREDPPARRAPVLARLEEEFVPQTRAEKRWAAAYAKLEVQERRQEADQKRFDVWKEFLDTTLGGSVQASFELLRRGKAEEAANNLEGLLPEISGLDPEIQQPILKAAVRLFKESQRQDLLARSLFTYLENLREQLTQGGLDGRTKEAQAVLLEDVQRLLADARVRAQGGI